MADILLTVGVEPSLSFTEFEKGINALVSKLNAHPPKIKVVLDDASIKSMKAQILSLKQEVKMSTRTDGYAMDKSGIWVKNTSAIKENTKAKKENVAASKQTANVQNGYAKTDSGIWLKSTTAINENTKAKQKNASANKLVDRQGDYSKTEAGIWVKNTSSIAENTTAKEKNAQISKQIITTSDGYSKTASGIWVKETEQINANTVAKQKNAQASKASATGVSSGGYTQTASGIWIKEAAAIDKSTTAKVKNATAQKKVQKEAEILTAGSQKQQTAIQQVNSLYAQTTKNMRNWTAAQKSSYGVAGHYNNLGEQAEQLKTLKGRLEEGKISAENYRKSYNGIKESISTSNEAIKEAGANTKSLGDRVGSLSSKFASWLTISQVIMAAVRTMKEMVSASIEVENAMTQIKIVTGASETEMKNFLTTSISLAKELGQSVTDVASSIETFARLGYNMDQSTQLAKYANIMSNVGNTDVSSATTGITSIIKGYELNPSDAEHVSDVLVKVGQEYAISAEELMEAFERGGAALHASGTDFEKSAALFAATNASLQNAETTGTMWKTVSARIRGATTELEEMGEETDGLAQGLSKYEAEIKALSGVDIMKDKNTYKDMYEIFVELAQVWDKMPDVSQSRVAEILGGTRNTSGIMSTITNIKDAIGAYSSALDSAGTAEKANAEYMDTTKAKIGELKAAFQELSSTFVKSDFLKIGVDGLKGFIEMIDKLISSIGSLNTILLGVGITKGIKNIFEAKKAGTANGMSGTLASAFPQISEGISAASAKFKELSKAGSSTFAALKGGASAFLGSINPLTAGIAAIGIAITAYSAYQQHIKEQAQAATQASEAWGKTQDSLADYKTQIIELRSQLASGVLSETEAYNTKSQLLSIQQELTKSYGDQASAINLVNGELSTQTDLIDSISQKEAQKYLNENASAISKAEEKMTTKKDYWLGSYDPTSKKGKQIAAAVEEMEKKYGKSLYVTPESGYGDSPLYTVRINADVTQADEAINEFMSKLRDIGGQDTNIENASAELAKVNEIENDYGETYEKSINARITADKKYYSDINGNVNTASEWLNKYSDAVQKYNDALMDGDTSKISDAKKEFDDVGNSVTNLLKGDMKDYAGVFNDIGDKLNTATINANRFKDVLEGKGTSKGDSIFDENYERYSDAYQNLLDEQQKIEDWGLSSFGNVYDKSGYSFTQTKFGNVDMDKRTIIKWSDTLKKTYADALASWDYDPEIGSIDTVFGGSARFGEDLNEKGWEIAFTPILPDGQFLSKDTVYEYINSILSDAYANDGKVTEDELANLDAQGRQIGNQFVHGIFAAVDDSEDYDDNGNWADTVGRLMHFSGDFGAISLAYDDIAKAAKEAGMSTEEFISKFSKTSDAVNSVKDAADELKDLKLDDKDFIGAFETDGVQKGEEQIQALVQAALDAGVISDTSSESIAMLASQLVSLGYLSGEPVEGLNDTTNAIATLTTALTDLQKVQTNVQQALQDSMSGTGLTAEDITNVTNAYKDLESYNPYKLFEETANGVHLNRDELARLNDELTNSKLSDFNNQIEDLRNQIYEARAEGKDTSGLEDQLTNAKLLKSELEGATSAYNQLMQAMSGSNERDSYSTIGESYEKMKTTLDEGWYGDSSLNKYLDLLLSADQRTNDTQKDFEKLTKTIEGTSHNIMDYWQYDDDGNLVTDGLYDFMDDVNKKLGNTFSQKNSDGLYQFDFDKEKLQEVADAFGMSTEAVELFERAMIDAGMAVDMSDFDYAGQLDKAIEKLKELQGLGQFSNKIDLDFDVDDSSIEQIRSYIDSLNGERVNIDAETNPDAAAALDELIAKCNQTYYAKINAEYDGSLDTAVGLVEQLQQLTATPISVEAKMSNADQIHDLAVQLAALPKDVQIAVGVKAENAGDTNSIINQLNHNPSSIKVPVDYEKGKEPEGVKDAKGKANYDVGLYPKTIPDASAKVNYKLGSYPTSLPSLTQTIYQTIVGGSSGSSGGGKKLDNKSKKKSSKAYGTAYAAGHDWALFSDEDALVNELGTESIVRDGKWFPIPGGAHVEQLKKGDIVFSAEQTRELIKTGRVISGGGHGQVALASGTAYNTLNAYESGSKGKRRSKRGKTTSASKRTTKKKSSSKSKGSSNSKSSSSKATKEAKEFEEQIDWIEIAITRATEAINRLKTVAESTFQTLTTRNNALGSEVSAISNKIGVETQAYNAYMAQANALGLDESYASKVRNGQMDISTITDEDLSKKIKKYQDYYNNAIQARDAIAELHEEIANLYKAKFDNVSKNFESQIKLIEQEKGLYNTFIDEVETSGHFASAKYYDYLISTEQKNIDALKKEYSALSDAFTTAASSGEIKEGSEAWNDMYLSVLDVQTALEDANKSLIEYKKNMRQLKWDIFDKQEEYISQIQEESDFLVDLMSNQQLYDKDTGKDTKYATASKGLHAVNMNAYMAQADDYGKEVLKIDKEIANDPYNTDLIDRRNELLKSQREAIKNAEDEKQKIKELVKDGYDAQLEALQKLVDKQKENLNAQKDAYEYQQNIQEKTKNIAALQKQFQAMKGDTSEETQATIQKTQVSLQDAQKDLKETEYQQWVSDQESLLDSVVNQVQEWQNSRLDDLDGLISQEIDSINSRAGEIADTISREAGSVGTTLSSQMTSIWNSSDGLAGVISGYYNGFQTNATSTLTTIQTIRDYVANLSKKADAEAAEKARQAEAQRQAAAAKAQQAAQAASKPASTPAPSPQPAQQSTPSWGSWFISKRDSYPKGRLNQNSIVDRLKYRNIDSSFSARAGYYSAMGGSGRYTGSSKQNNWMVSQMKAHGYARGTKNATAGWHLVNEVGNELGVKSGHLENFNDGDIVFNGSQTDKLWNFSRDPEAFMQNLASTRISPSIGSQTSNAQIDVGGINIEMNGVNNPQQFSQSLRDELAKNPKTQNMIKSMLYEKGDSFKRFKN